MGYLTCILLFGIFLCFLSCKKQIEVSNATLKYSYESKGLLVISMKNGKSFIIDTGADRSFIFSDRIKINSTIRGKVKVRANNVQSLFLRKIDSLQIGDWLIKNNHFVFMKGNSSAFKNDTNIVGIIGMDILSQKYCYFDIKNQTITFSDKKEIEAKSPSFIFVYEISGTPKSNINVNGTVFEDVMFDTGFNTFLELFEDDRKKLNLQTSVQTDTFYDIFNNQRLVCYQKPDSIEINDVLFTSPQIIYGKKYRLLGTGFVSRWSSFSIDPFKKEIEFYL